MQLKPEFKICFRVLILLFLPIVAISFAYQLLSFFPGVVKVVAFDWFASFLWLFCAYLVFRLVVQFRVKLVLKVMALTLVCCYGISGALLMHVHSRCEPSSMYVGGDKVDTSVANVSQNHECAS